MHFLIEKGEERTSLWNDTCQCIIGSSTSFMQHRLNNTWQLRSKGIASMLFHDYCDLHVILLSKMLFMILSTKFTRTYIFYNILQIPIKHVILTKNQVTLSGSQNAFVITKIHVNIMFSTTTFSSSTCTI